MRFIKIAILFSLMAVLPLSFSACSDDVENLGQTVEPDGSQDSDEGQEPDDDQGADEDQEAVMPTHYFTLTVLTYNSLSISYGSSNATACYLLVTEAGETIDEQMIIEQGESVEVNCEGIYTAEGLTPRTYYCIEFLAINGDKSSRLSMQFMTPAEPEQ